MAEYKPCFGREFGYVSEGRILSEEQRTMCRECPDFDRCFRISLVTSIYRLRDEVKKSARGIRNSLGGSHREFPFG